MLLIRQNRTKVGLKRKQRHRVVAIVSHRQNRTKVGLKRSIIRSRSRRASEAKSNQGGIETRPLAPSTILTTSAKSNQGGIETAHSAGVGCTATSAKSNQGGIETRENGIYVYNGAGAKSNQGGIETCPISMGTNVRWNGKIEPRWD